MFSLCRGDPFGPRASNRPAGGIIRQAASPRLADPETSVQFFDRQHGGKKHERKAARSARCGRVVCRAGDSSGSLFRKFNRAARKCEAAGCRWAGAGKKRKKKGREEGREERPAAEV